MTSRVDVALRFATLDCSTIFGDFCCHFYRNGMPCTPYLLAICYLATQAIAAHTPPSALRAHPLAVANSGVLNLKLLFALVLHFPTRWLVVVHAAVLPLALLRSLPLSSTSTFACCRSRAELRQCVCLGLGSSIVLTAGVVSMLWAGRAAVCVCSCACLTGSAAKHVDEPNDIDYDKTRLLSLFG